MADISTDLEFDSHLVGTWWELHSQVEATKADPRETVLVAAGVGLAVLAFVSGMLTILQTSSPWWAGLGLLAVGLGLLGPVWRIAVSPVHPRPH